MTYDVALTPTAEADLRRLDSAVARRAIDKMQWLADNIETIRIETLADSWQDLFKLRVGGLPPLAKEVRLRCVSAGLGGQREPYMGQFES